MISDAFCNGSAFREVVDTAPQTLLCCSVFLPRAFHYN
jgi:hypothetical protein